MWQFVVFMFVISSAYKLPCIYKEKTEWSNDVYHCDLANDIESNSSDVVTKILGDHVKGKLLLDVKGFSSEGKILRYFPQGLEAFFSVSMFFFIRIDNAELKEIHQKDLANFWHIQVLSLNTNHIEVIEEDLFSHSPMLNHIILSNNRIKYIAHGVFKRLSIQTLMIVNNTCISDYANNTFDDLGNRKVDVPRLLHEIGKKCESRDKNYRASMR